MHKCRKFENNLFERALMNTWDISQYYWLIITISNSQIPFSSLALSGISKVSFCIPGINT